MADEDEDEGEENGWVDCHVGNGEGFVGRHCRVRGDVLDVTGRKYC